MRKLQELSPIGYLPKTACHQALNIQLTIQMQSHMVSNNI